jgi:putative transposase
MKANRIRSRGRLPHWESEHGIYFVTFRLADSLPQAVLRDLLLNEKTKAPSQRQPSKKVEEYLDQASGACCLRQPVVADLVASALRHFDGTRYHLLAWCIMPNHVHVVFQAFEGYTLEVILHSWKSFTASGINHYLSRKGTLWQREYYDHLIRDGNQLLRAISYTAENPAKCGLTNWPYVYVSAEVFGGPAHTDVTRKNQRR